MEFRVVLRIVRPRPFQACHAVGLSGLLLSAGAASACSGLDAAAAAKFVLYAAECGPPASVEPSGVDRRGFVQPPAAVAIPLAAKPDAIAPAPPLSLVEQVARSHRIDPVLLATIVHQESAGRPGAVSPKGAVGLMQVMPATARELGLADPSQLRDPTTNLLAGATYLKRLQAAFGGDLALTLAAYNAGPGAVRRHHGVPPFRETRGYVGRILARYRAAAGAGR